MIYDENRFIWDLIEVRSHTPVTFKVVNSNCNIYSHLLYEFELIHVQQFTSGLEFCGSCVNCAALNHLPFSHSKYEPDSSRGFPSLRASNGRERGR